MKQSLDYVEKEREIDLKEREAIVYRAESLQREFDHVNKLLQVWSGVSFKRILNYGPCLFYIEIFKFNPWVFFFTTWYIQSVGRDRGIQRTVLG